MTWRETLRTASFRGIRFGVAEQRGSSHGRRGQLAEYPGRDDPHFKDTGRKARQYTITAIITGDDYTSRRDRVIKACEKEGSGILIHPDYGFLRVNCTACEVSHASANGRRVELSLEFVESGQALFPILSSTKQGAAVAKAVEMAQESSDTFLQYWNMDGAPQYVVAAGETVVADVAEFSAGLAGPFSGTGAAAQLSGLADDAATVATDPTAILAGLEPLADLYGDVNSAATTPTPKQLTRQVSIASYYGDNDGSVAYINDYGVPVVKTINRTTDAGEQEYQNQQAMFRLFWEQTIAASLQVASQIEYESYNEAAELRESIVTLIDRAREATPNETLYQQLDELRVLAYLTVPDPDADLPRLVAYTTARNVPAVVVAYELYQDAERAAEIVARNSIPNPASIAAGTTIQVLTA